MDTASPSSLSGLAGLAGPAGPAGLAVLGGSFNPPHFGHLRLALEMFEALRPERVDFVPCAVPPHKREASLLPFEWRCSMLREAVAGRPYFSVNPLEAGFSGPSFTCTTLRAYREEYARARLCFILGSEDLAGLDKWKDWRDLPGLATLAVASRKGEAAEQVAATVRRLWPGAGAGRPWGEGRTFSLPGGGELCYIPVTRLDIASSLIRARWLEGRSIEFLAPAEVRDFLSREAVLVRRYWTTADNL